MIKSQSDFVRFGVFELDLHERVLRREGRRVRLQDKPFEVLTLLVEHHGELVSRDELRARLWPADTFVVFDDSLNTAVRKVRGALGDSANGSRFIETIPRRGYRFLADVTGGTPARLESRASFAAPTAVQSRTGRWLAAGVVLFTFVALAARFWPATPVASRMIRTVPLTTMPGTEYLPTYSPDGTSVAFAADTNGDFDIWVRRFGSDSLVMVSGEYRGQDTSPAWSPDGASIAFASERGGGGIYVVPAGGGAARRLASVPFTPSPDLPGSVPTLAWSPESSHLVYAYGIEGDAGLWTLSLSGGTARQLPLPAQIRPFSIVHPAWSPDGDRIFFAVLSGSLHTRAQIWSVRSDGSDPVAVTDTTSANLHPRFANRKLFFLSDRAGTSDVYTQAITPAGRPEGKPLPVTTGIGIGSFAVSLDGRRLIYSKAVERSNIWAVALEPAMPASWSTAAPVTTENQTVEFLDISEDGRIIVFDSTRAGSSNLWAMNIDGTGLRQITSDSGDEWHPSLSPDGRRAVYHAMRNGNREIFTVSLDGGSPVQLTNHPAKDWLPRWSPDGRSIAFVSDRAGNQDIFIISSEGGDARALTDDPHNDHNPVWARDGRRVIFASNRSGADDLYVVSREGGSAIRITRDRWDDLVPLAVSADGCCVYVSGRGRSRPVGFWRVRMTDGLAEVLLPGGFTSHQLGVSAATDGRRLLFPVWERSADLWMGELDSVH